MWSLEQNQIKTAWRLEKLYKVAIHWRPLILTKMAEDWAADGFWELEEVP